MRVYSLCIANCSIQIKLSHICARILRFKRENEKKKEDQLKFNIKKIKSKQIKLIIQFARCLLKSQIYFYLVCVSAHFLSSLD